VVYTTSHKEKEMEIEIKQEDVESVIKANPLMALQVENQALRRKLQEGTVAYEKVMLEKQQLAQELEALKNGKNAKEK
jgi:regulator of replication initiation timing|tara:strand:- start:81 stop:314 length:234 start_codon:yes stop_codon:yes gene_type:complete